MTFHCRRGYSEEEIQAAFKKYDVDGDKVLDESEQKRMQEDLEGQRVSSKSIRLLIMKSCTYGSIDYTYSMKYSIITGDTC